MKLSIIIPLYNTEKYIEKCIKSIYINNDLLLEDFEVFVINDGSTDSGKRIVEQLQIRFKNIKLINKENGGQSSARNIGFKLAQGTYVFCLDSDDFIEGSAIAESLNYCFKMKLDMLPISFERYDENYNLLQSKRDLYPVIKEPITGGEFLDNYVISGSMWRYFYKSEIIKTNNLYLTEGIYHEDEEFIVKFLSYAQRICYQKHKLYNHLVRGNSTVNKKEKKHRLKLLNDIVTVIANLKIHREKFILNKPVYEGITKKIEQLTFSIFLRMKSDGLTIHEVQNYINELRLLGMYPLSFKHLGLKFRIAATIFNNYFLYKSYYK